MPLSPIIPRATTNRYGLVMVGTGLAIDTDGSLMATTGGGGDALTSNPLSQFAATTSAQLRGVLSDETGTGAAVFATSPTLVTPVLGAATATSVNKVAITAPASSATITIADGKTLTASNSLTLAGTDSTTITFPSTSITVPPLDLDVATPLNSVYRYRFSDWNFISNASFESWLSGTTSAPDGWFLQGTATIARDSTAFQGTYSAALTFGAATDGELYAIFGANSLVDYTYTAYVTRTSGTGTARMVAQQNFGSYTEDVSVNLPTGGGQQLVSLTFRPSLDGNYRINFKAGDSAGSTWRIDEVKVQESKYVATAWTPNFIDDSFSQNVYGAKTFSNITFSSTATGSVSGSATQSDDLTRIHSFMLMGA